ncbi:MAG TPA: terminase family protein [Allosphingosinicella sp.]|jgi:phage terminase large subunit-like protein
MIRPDPADFVDLLERAAWSLGDEDWDWFLRGLSPPVRRRLFEEFFHWQTHGGQAEPPARTGPGSAPWRVWFIRAGRGFGKTLTGSHWVHDRARETAGARIALVGHSMDEVRRVMVEGPAGLLATARCGEPVTWHRKDGVVRFASGSEAFAYSAEAAEKLRGPEHDFAWCDELAKWRHGDRAWDNLQMGMRRGPWPRLIVTTTPRPVALVRRVLALNGTVETRGRTEDNVHSSEAFREWARETYGGTRLGRQELDGELFDEVAGALWTREMLESARVDPFDPAGDSARLARVVVGVDPPASAEGDACGIVVCALGRDGIAYVLADCSVSGERPEGWARAVSRAAQAWGADRVLAENNQGGDMVESVLRNADAAIPVRPVGARGSKSARAEPVAALFEAGRARLAGRFPELEDELAGLTHGGGYQGPGRSPDRADAMVWAISALVRPRAEPRITLL